MRMRELDCKRDGETGVEVGRCRSERNKEGGREREREKGKK